MRKNCQTILAGLLSLFLLFGLLPGTALAATASNNIYGEYTLEELQQKEGDFILINEVGSDKLILGAGEEPVLDLKPGITYHVSSWTCFPMYIGELTSQRCYLTADIVKDDFCTKGENGTIWVRYRGYEDNLGDRPLCFGAILGYTAADNVHVSVVPSSLRLFSDDSPEGTNIDEQHKVLTETNISIAEVLFAGTFYRIEFDVLVESAEQAEIDEYLALLETDTNLETDAGLETDPVSETPPTNGENDTPDDPRLPGTFSGVVTTNFRTSYKSDSRPDTDVMNAITDDPNWGNELYFLHLVDLSTGEEFRQGTVQLKAGCQYQVEIVVHNASGSYSINRRANDVTATIEMPRELPGGSLGTLGATISASNTVPVAVSAALGLYCAESVRLEYMVDSATYQSAIGGNGTQLDYEQLFTDGARLGSVYGGADGGHITLIIRAVTDETIPVAIGEDRLENPVFATAYTQLTRDPEAIDDPAPTNETPAPEEGEANDGAEAEGEKKGNNAAAVVGAVVLLALGACALGCVNGGQKPSQPSTQTQEEQPGAGADALPPPEGEEKQDEDGEQ